MSSSFPCLLPPSLLTPTSAPLDPGPDCASSSCHHGGTRNKDKELKPGQDTHGIVTYASTVPFSLPFL